MVKTIVAIVIVYLVAVVGWITLAGTITYRTDHQDTQLKNEVGQLWGTPLEQHSPAAALGVDRIDERTDAGVGALRAHDRVTVVALADGSARGTTARAR